MDIRLIAYYFFILTGACCSAVTGFYVGKRKGLSSETLRIYIPLALVFGLSGSFLMGQLQNYVMSLTGLAYYVSRMRIFGGLLFTPVLMYLPVRYVAGDFSQVTDILAPGAYLILAFSKIGCAVYGCCYGIECSVGVSTPFESHTVFPVQLLESALCFALFAAMLFVTVKNKHRKGAMYPVVLILYGVVRFFVEYLRYYPQTEKTYFFGVSFWQLVSIITVLAGAVWLIWLCRCQRIFREEQKGNMPCE